jgi:D-3-phosphoglycerate dehydrogenase
MNDPLLHHARVMVTPHAAYYSVEGDEEGRGRAVHNIIDFARCGRPNDFVVTGTK